MPYIAHEENALHAYLGLSKADPTKYMGSKQQKNYGYQESSNEEFSWLLKPAIERTDNNYSLQQSSNKKYNSHSLRY